MVFRSNARARLRREPGRGVLQRKGRLPRESDVDDETTSSEPELLALVSAASVR